MTDPTLEERLEAALDARASRVDTETPDLVAGARARSAARRRRTAVVAGGASVAAVVLAAVVLPGVLTDRDGGTPPIATDPTPTVPSGKDVRTGPDGWKQVVFHDLTFAVPQDWRPGSVDQWCIGSGKPAVQLPGMAQTEVACMPLRGLGVVVTEPGQDPPPQDPGDYADGTSLAQVTRGGWTVTVSTDSADVTDDVAASVRVLDAGDRVNGCPVQLDVPALGAAGTVEEDPVSACLYDVRVAGPSLTGTVRLDSGAAAAARSALTGAPKGTGPDAGPGTCDDWPEDSVLAVLGRSAPVAWVHFSGCDGHGVDLGSGDTRKLTEAVMQLVLDTGWSGGTVGGVPMPGQSGGDPDGSVSSDG